MPSLLTHCRSRNAWLEKIAGYLMKREKGGSPCSPSPSGSASSWLPSQSSAPPPGAAAACAHLLVHRVVHDGHLGRLQLADGLHDQDDREDQQPEGGGAPPLPVQRAVRPQRLAELAELAGGLGLPAGRHAHRLHVPLRVPPRHAGLPNRRRRSGPLSGGGCCPEVWLPPVSPGLNLEVLRPRSPPLEPEGTPFPGHSKEQVPFQSQVFRTTGGARAGRAGGTRGGSGVAEQGAVFGPATPGGGRPDRPRDPPAGARRW